MSKAKSRATTKPKAQARHTAVKHAAAPKKAAVKLKDTPLKNTSATPAASNTPTHSSSSSVSRLPHLHFPSFWQIMNPAVAFISLFIIIFGGLYVVQNYESPAAKDMIERDIVSAFSEVKIPPSFELTAESTGGKEILMQLNRTYVYTTPDSQEAAFHILRESLRQQNFILSDVQTATEQSSLEAVGVVNKSALYLTAALQANPTIIVINAHR